MRERRVVVDFQFFERVIKFDTSITDRRSIQRAQEALSNVAQFDPSRRIPPGDDEPTAINDNHAGGRKRCEGLIGVGKPLDRPAQLRRVRGSHCTPGKTKSIPVEVEGASTCDRANSSAKGVAAAPAARERNRRRTTPIS
jgi:hypothetical protein